jgi:hypothetical protein
LISVKKDLIRVDERIRMIFVDPLTATKSDNINKKSSIAVDIFDNMNEYYCNLKVVMKIIKNFRLEKKEIKF